MNRYAEAIAIVERATEEKFINSILALYLGYRNIRMHATQVPKPEQEGGDVKFVKVRNDIIRHLKQREDTIVTLFLDYYGLAEWPGLDSIPMNSSPAQIEQILVSNTMNGIKELLPDIPIKHRFIPFFVVHEFETLLFSDTEILADGLNIRKERIDDVIIQFSGDLERINNSRETAPSKRLEQWFPSYKKTVTGIPIAERIGVDQMRNSVPLFDAWLKAIGNAAGSEAL